jgi:hypothetical protein
MRSSSSHLMCGALRIYLLFAQPVLAQEQVLAFRTVEQKMFVSVATGGCTNAEDFDVRVSLRKRIGVELTFVRRTPDYCKEFFPEGVELMFDLGRLDLPSGVKVFLGNPILDRSR